MNRRRTSPRLRPFALAFAAIAFARLLPAQADDNAPEFDRIRPPWYDDPTVHMVAIEGLVVEINEDRTRDIGIHTGFAGNPAAAVGGADILLGPAIGPVRVPTFEGDADGTDVGFTPRLPGLGLDLVGIDVNGGFVSARLRTLLQHGEARIMTRPVALAVNGTKTTIDVGSKVPYADIDAKGAPSEAEQNIGVLMEVTPKIMDLTKRTVELDVSKVEVTSLAMILTTNDVDRPVFNTSSTRTKLTMKSGETYRVSSYKGRREVEIREGIPVLMRIPVLGRLFSSVQQVERNVDILFFITPHIVPPGENIVLPYDFQHGQDLLDQGFVPTAR